MTFVPRPLFGRLLAVSTLTTIAALAFAAFSIGHVLERFVVHGLDQQLDAEAQVLARAVRPDGMLDQARVVNLPAFEADGEGWGWRVESAAGQWAGGDPIDVRPLPPRVPAPSRHAERGRERPGLRPGDDTAVSGEQITSASSASGPEPGPRS